MTARNLTSQKIGEERTGGFADLDRRGQIGRLRRLAGNALARFGIEAARLTCLRHEHNTTFRVDHCGKRFLLRLSRPGTHTVETVESELAWLGALRRDTSLAVPEPVPATDGSLVVVASAPDVPGPRLCVLLRWLEGRFADRRLAPVHLQRVGELTAGLQEHAAAWSPPAGFLRPSVHVLTTEGRTASLTGSAQAALRGSYPTPDDAERGRELLDPLVSRADASLFERGVDRARTTLDVLGREPGGFGLLHADLHYDNFLFHGDEACAIDFDDCGWGVRLYDLAVTLWELEERPRYPELRDALVTAYARELPLPSDHERHLESLFQLRRLQMLMWVLESREHPSFRGHWQAWARELLDEIAARPATTARR
jgi:Ser/Thr protein kinase RdoA (MazF antagonist)